MEIEKISKEPIFPLLAFRQYQDKFVFLGKIENLAELEFNFQDYDSDLEQDIIITDFLKRKLRVKINLKIKLLEVTDEIFELPLENEIRSLFNTMSQKQRESSECNMLICLWKWFKGLLSKRGRHSPTERQGW